MLFNSKADQLAELQDRLLEVEAQMMDDADRHAWEQQKFNSICDKRDLEVKMLEAKVQQLTQALTQQAALTPPAPIVIKKPTVKIKQRRFIKEQELANHPALQLQMIRNRFKIDGDIKIPQHILIDWLDDNCTGLYATWEDPQTWEIIFVAFELDDDWALFKLKFHGAT